MKHSEMFLSNTNTEHAMEKYVCINCGSKVKELYKQYSSDVLKLTTCNKCHCIADKYIEFDLVLVIIDLILLGKEGYRHIIFNTEFKGYWKLIFLILIMEAYAEWSVAQPKTEISPFNDDFYIGNFRFYRHFAAVLIRYIAFEIPVLVLTYLYNTFYKKEPFFILIFLKTTILSSFGLFLLLPSLIWNHEIQDFHFTFILFYSALSQLFAYEAICNCSKLWSIVVIGISYTCKLLSSSLYYNIESILVDLTF